MKCETCDETATHAIVSSSVSMDEVFGLTTEGEPDLDSGALAQCDHGYNIHHTGYFCKDCIVSDEGFSIE